MATKKKFGQMRDFYPIQKAANLSYALNVLSADPSSRADESTLNVALLIGAAVLLLYGLAVGIGLLGGDIALDTAYLWMMPIPLALAACYGLGFARDVAARRDAGLLLSALGWLMVAFCLFTLHGAVRAALASGLRLDQMTPTPLSWFFAALAIAGIGTGALLSFQHWQKETV